MDRFLLLAFVWEWIRVDDWPSNLRAVSRVKGLYLSWHCRVVPAGMRQFFGSRETAFSMPVQTGSMGSYNKLVYRWWSFGHGGERREKGRIDIMSFLRGINPLA